MIYITHDQEEAFALSDRIMVMGGGRIHQLADPEEIMRIRPTMTCRNRRAQPAPQDGFPGAFLGR